MSYKIEAGVPLPSATFTPMRKLENIPLYDALEALKRGSVGDSFFIPRFDRKIAPKATVYAKRQHIQVTTRREHDGLRVWRIA